MLTHHGRGGEGTASIVPHLNRQQEINDRPAETMDAAAEMRSVKGELAAVQAQQAETLRRANELLASGGTQEEINEAMHRADHLQTQVNAIQRRLHALQHPEARIG